MKHARAVPDDGSSGTGASPDRKDRRREAAGRTINRVAGDLFSPDQPQRVPPSCSPAGPSGGQSARTPGEVRKRRRKRLRLSALKRACPQHTHLRCGAPPQAVVRVRKCAKLTEVELPRSDFLSATDRPFFACRGAPRPCDDGLRARCCPTRKTPGWRHVRDQDVGARIKEPIFSAACTVARAAGRRVQAEQGAAGEARGVRGAAPGCRRVRRWRDERLCVQLGSRKYTKQGNTNAADRCLGVDTSITST